MESTEHPRIFYKEKADKFDRGEFDRAKLFADAFSEFTIIITMGPFRFYDMLYEVFIHRREIHLDFYSVHMATKEVMVEALNECAHKIDYLIRVPYPKQRRMWQNPFYCPYWRNFWVLVKIKCCKCDKTENLTYVVDPETKNRVLVLCEEHYQQFSVAYSFIMAKKAKKIVATSSQS